MASARSGTITQRNLKRLQVYSNLYVWVVLFSVGTMVMPICEVFFVMQAQTHK